MVAASGDLERREMFAEIRKLCAPDNVTNWRILAGEYAFLAVVVAACVGSYQWITAHGWSLWWMAPIYLASVVMIGVWTQNRLGVLIHESSHYLLFKNRVLNDVVANLLVAFPLFGVIRNYRIGHWGHHRHVNDPQRDPDLRRLIKHQARDFPITRKRFLWEYLLKQISPHKALSYLKGRAEYVALAARQDEPTRNLDALGDPWFQILRISYYAALVAVLTWFGWWPHFVLLWLVPMVTFFPAVLFLREIAHHGNYPDNGDYTNSRVYDGKWLEREIFFPFGERNHVLHHMFPTIPWHKVIQAHGVMMRFPPYREKVVFCNGFFFKSDLQSDRPTVLEVLAAPSRTFVRGQDGVEHPDEIRQTTAEEVGRVRAFADTWRSGES